MPSHRHLRRLDQVWVTTEIYFVTTCTASRRRCLASQEVFDILLDEWRQAWGRHGWKIGRFLIMPDHLHFFCAPNPASVPLSQFMGSFKQWSSKRVLKALELDAPLWQPEFFDHLLRGHDSYEEKSHYTRQNPVRAGLVARTDDWPWQGEFERFQF